ncbi:MAG: hypothetical protein V4795_00425 [Pseudomonadota bacterium]
MSATTPRSHHAGEQAPQGPSTAGAGAPAHSPQARRSIDAPRLHYVKRGRFRVSEPLPDHQQATVDLLDSLPVHGLPATTVRELLHAMACVLVSLEYKARHQPHRTIGDRDVMMPWYVTYAAQAKALLYAARLSGDEHRLTDGADFPPDMPVPAPLVVTADDCRKRFLDIFNDGALCQALMPLHTVRTSDDDRKRLADAVAELHHDLVRAGVVRVADGDSA